MNILSYIVLAAGEAFFLWQKTRDWAKSALQPLHLPPGEQNFLTRGKDGYFSATKSYIVNGVVIILFTLAAIFIPQEHTPFIVGGIFFAWGFFVMNGIRKDVATKDANFEKQRSTLVNLKAGMGLNYSKVRLQAYGGKSVWVYGTFYDFHVDTGLPYGIHTVRPEDQIAMLAIIEPRLLKVAQKPESEWFKRDRAEGI